MGSIQHCMACMAHLQAAAAETASTNVKSEAALYLEVPAAPMQTDVLEWWSLNEMKFLALIVMVRQYFRVQATSA